VSEEWVVNASPLILLSRIARLDLIERLAPKILVPNAVIEEVRAGHHKDRTAAVVWEWAARYRVEDIAVVASIEHWDRSDLGLGHRAGGTAAQATLGKRCATCSNGGRA